MTIQVWQLPNKDERMTNAQHMRKDYIAMLQKWLKLAEDESFLPIRKEEYNVISKILTTATSRLDQTKAGRHAHLP